MRCSRTWTRLLGWIPSAVLAGSLFTAFGCASVRNVAEGTGERIEAGARRANETVRDSSISYAVGGKMTDDRVVDAKSLRVETRNGVVTLTGVQPSAYARDRAVWLARQVKGVKGVVDHIEVRPQHP